MRERRQWELDERTILILNDVFVMRIISVLPKLFRMILLKKDMFAIINILLMILIQL